MENCSSLNYHTSIHSFIHSCCSKVQHFFTPSIGKKSCMVVTPMTPLILLLLLDELLLCFDGHQGFNNIVKLFLDLGHPQSFIPDQRYWRMSIGIVSPQNIFEVNLFRNNPSNQYQLIRYDKDKCIDA